MLLIYGSIEHWNTCYFSEHEAKGVQRANFFIGHMDRQLDEWMDKVMWKGDFVPKNVSLFVLRYQSILLRRINL